MSKILLEKPLVSVDWLYANLHAPNLVILDATIPKVVGDVHAVSEDFQIPNARFFDIKKKFSDIHGAFPNTFPSEEQFTSEAQRLGINQNSAIVIYDTIGIYSSARAWWLFKAFGHQNVAVLNGGLPEWKQKNYSLEQKQTKEITPGNFTTNVKPNMMVFFEDIQKIKTNKNYVILDARSSERFEGVVPEPRKSLRSGTIPNSKNLPFDSILENQKLLDSDRLKSIFKNITEQENNLVFSCGSGITACILALGAESIGYKNLAVYDGSWTEYGSLITKEKNMHWTKDELVAYTLLYAANSNFIEDNKERNVIIERVDMQTFQKVHDEFDADNDYQSLQKIQNALKEHNYTEKDIEGLLAEIKNMFFADGAYDVMERIMYRSLKKILS